MWHDKIVVKSHAGERKRGMWHDWAAGEGHAGEGKMVCGMTGRQEKVMPEREKWYVA